VGPEKESRNKAAGKNEVRKNLTRKARGKEGGKNLYGPSFNDEGGGSTQKVKDEGKSKGLKNPEKTRGLEGEMRNWRGTGHGLTQGGFPWWIPSWTLPRIGIS